MSLQFSMNRLINRTLDSMIYSAIREVDSTMNTVTANELKTKGVSAVEARLETNDEVIISVRGQDKYVVIAMEKYVQLQEYELVIALQEAKADIGAGRSVSESVEEHMQRVTDGL